MRSDGQIASSMISMHDAPMKVLMLVIALAGRTISDLQRLTQSR